MKRAAVVTIAASSLLAGLLTAAVPASAAPPSNPEDRLDVYSGEILRSQVGDIVDLGVDRHEIELEGVEGPASDPAKAEVAVETILSGEQAEQLREEGLDLELKEVEGGDSVAQRATLQAAEGYEVFQMYAGPGGLQEEIQQAAAENPDIAKLVTIGQSTNGQDIQAVKVTRNAQNRPDGSRPSTLYMSAQHAREWITPEMTTRLLAYVLENYENDREIRRLVNQTELWFLPVANPDGYDFTFEEDQRLWRKNLRDNNGDGQITPGDGVDLNRNFDYKWGYDNEGSSPEPGSETYRGPSPGSEPETQALDAFVGDVGFEFLVNYHSAAELLLHGVGWQVATPGPDDVIYEAMVGDDETPAVPGYDPDLSAELYITNGETTGHMQEVHGTLGFTPEMATCESASESVPDDEWEAEECGSGFEFPDDEELVQTEFEKNIPFAIATGQSALDPDDPVSVVGRTAADFVVDSFDVSYGDPQTVAVTAKRALRNVRLNYSVNGVRQRTQAVQEWEGGERYGGAENADYYAEFRADVRGTAPGDVVEVWYTGTKPGTGRVESERFTYSAQSETGADVLVIANEDYTGVNPDYPDTVTAPKYAAAHVAAVEAAGYTADVWDVDAEGVPHHLGVLGHYDAIVWYTGDDRIAQDPQDELTDTPFGPLPDISVKESQQYLTIAVRDYLNEGGKLVNAGETAQYQGLPGISDAVGGLYYGLNGDPTAECVIDPEGSTAGFFEDCLILADDFRQYWLGAYTRTDVVDPTQVDGVADPLTGLSAQLGGPVVEGDNPLDEAGAFQVTSDVLPVDEFPQFASQGAAEYSIEGGPYSPIEGTRYAGALHADSSYMRLSQTVDLTGATSGELAFQLSASTEQAYDHVIVEARTAGGSDWTTLPEAGGLSTTSPPAECTAGGFLLALHPFLGSYLGGANCTAPGTSGVWNSITGSTGGWQEVAYDLSGFAGSQVEVSISYVTDPNTGGVGVFVDDTRITVDGVVTADGFEGDTTAWTVAGPPAGSPPNTGNWQIAEELFTQYAATSTEDTLLLGFGLEQVATDEERAALVGAALNGLLATP